MEVFGKRIKLRPIAMSDLAICTRWASDPEIMHHVTGRTFDEAAEREWLENVLMDDNERVFLICNEHELPIGTCGIHLRPDLPFLKGESGVCIGITIGEKSEWGKGYGAEVVAVLAEHAHTAHGASRVWLRVDTEHKRALRAYEKAGFHIHREIQALDRPHTDGRQFLMEKLFQ